MILRAEVVNPWQNVVASVGAFALSTGGGSGGTGTVAGVHTAVILPPRLHMLDFDATFLTNKGELKVLLGDQLLKSIPASSRGVAPEFSSADRFA